MNEAKKTLTMEFIESIMDEKYTLVWVDYRESFDESRDLLQQCLESKAAKICGQRLRIGMRMPRSRRHRRLSKNWKATASTSTTSRRKRLKPSLRNTTMR